MLKMVIAKLRKVRTDFFPRKSFKEFQQKELKQIFCMIFQMNDPNMGFLDQLTCDSHH